MQALVAGFEAFGGEASNPAAEALRLLPPRLGRLALATRLLPVGFATAPAALEDAVVALDPEIVLIVGLAAGRAGLSVERVALNLIDARIPDNDGRQPVDRPVAADGPAAYFATLPAKRAVAALREAGLPAGVSDTAGTFVCNQAFYALMHLAALRRGQLQGGLLHVPYLPGQAARHADLAGVPPSMSLDDIVRGILIVLETAASRRDDIATAEGAIS